MNDDQLRDLLRSRDPAASLPTADPDQVARILEDTMTNDLEPTTRTRSLPEADPRRRTPLTWLLAAAAVLVIAGVGLYGVLSGPEDQRRIPDGVDPAATVLELRAPGPMLGRCAMVTADRLALQETAFDGEVTAIDERSVTLSVSHWYRGADTDLVTVQAQPARLQDLILAADFTKGERYLVSATDGVVSVCGMTASYDEDLAALYAEAFGA